MQCLFCFGRAQKERRGVSVVQASNNVNRSLTVTRTEQGFLDPPQLVASVGVDVDAPIYIHVLSTENTLEYSSPPEELLAATAHDQPTSIDLDQSHSSTIQPAVSEVTPQTPLAEVASTCPGVSVCQESVAQDRSETDELMLDKHSSLASSEAPQACAGGESLLYASIEVSSRDQQQHVELPQSDREQEHTQEPQQGSKGSLMNPLLAALDTPQQVTSATGSYQDLSPHHSRGGRSLLQGVQGQHLSSMKKIGSDSSLRPGHFHSVSFSTDVKVVSRDGAISSEPLVECESIIRRKAQLEESRGPSSLISLKSLLTHHSSSAMQRTSLLETLYGREVSSHKRHSTSDLLQSLEVLARGRASRSTNDRRESSDPFQRLLRRRAIMMEMFNHGAAGSIQQPSNSAGMSPRASPSAMSPRASPSAMSPRASPSAMSPRAFTSATSTGGIPSAMSTGASPSTMSPRAFTSSMFPRAFTSALSPRGFTSSMSPRAVPPPALSFCSPGSKMVMVEENGFLRLRMVYPGKALQRVGRSELNKP